MHHKYREVEGTSDSLMVLFLVPAKRWCQQGCTCNVHMFRGLKIPRYNGISSVDSFTFSLPPTYYMTGIFYRSSRIV